MLLILSAHLSIGQSSFKMGLLPSINLKSRISNETKVNLKIESRQIFKEGLFTTANTFDYDYELTDFALVTSTKIGLNNSIGVGYQIRFRGGIIFNRSIQQFTVVQRLESLRLAHRFSADQTFTNASKPQFRIRYRIATEIPFNGQSVDPKEFYFKFNNEYLNAFQGGMYNLEVRLVPALGYEFNDANKLEIGLNYRLDRFVNTYPRHIFWLGMNWYVSL